MDAVTDMDVTPTAACPLCPPRGVTLPELLTVLAVGAVLGALALPSFFTLLEGSRQTSHLDTLIAALHLARSEAITRGGTVVICKSADGAACDSTLRWQDGWLVFADHDENRAHDAAEPLIQYQQALGGADLRFSAFIGAGHYVVYRASGFSPTNGTFTYCDGRGATRARAVIISASGRVRVDTVTGSGAPLTCP